MLSCPSGLLEKLVGVRLLFGLLLTMLSTVLVTGKLKVDGKPTFQSLPPCPMRNLIPRRTPSGREERLGCTMTKDSAKTMFPWPLQPHNTILEKITFFSTVKFIEI